MMVVVAMMMVMRGTGLMTMTVGVPVVKQYKFKDGHTSAFTTIIAYHNLPYLYRLGTVKSQNPLRVTVYFSLMPLIPLSSRREFGPGLQLTQTH